MLVDLAPGQPVLVNLYWHHWEMEPTIAQEITGLVVGSSSEAQLRAMQTAAMTLFRDELHPALQRLAGSLQQQSRLARVESWLTHAAVAILASALSWATAAWLWAR